MHANFGAKNLINPLVSSHRVYGDSGLLKIMQTLVSLSL